MCLSPPHSISIAAWTLFVVELSGCKKHLSLKVEGIQTVWSFRTVVTFITMEENKTYDQSSLAFLPTVCHWRSKCCGVCSNSDAARVQHQSWLTVGGIYNSLPLPANWFWKEKSSHPHSHYSFLSTNLNWNFKMLDCPVTEMIGHVSMRCFMILGGD